LIFEDATQGLEMLPLPGSQRQERAAPQAEVVVVKRKRLDSDPAPVEDPEISCPFLNLLSGFQRSFPSSEISSNFRSDAGTLQMLMREPRFFFI
jgi:hypothetical protein